jgi:hypothetical protein
MAENWNFRYPSMLSQPIHLALAQQAAADGLGAGLLAPQDLHQQVSAAL